MSAPPGAPYFTGPGQWDAYLRWNLAVQCKGCGRRKMDEPTRYGLEPDPTWPECWITEEWCDDCWWTIGRDSGD